jgi:hypothetical protein
MQLAWIRRSTEVSYLAWFRRASSLSATMKERASSTIWCSVSPGLGKLDSGMSDMDEQQLLEWWCRYDALREKEGYRKPTDVELETLNDYQNLFD